MTILRGWGDVSFKARWELDTDFANLDPHQAFPKWPMWVKLKGGNILFSWPPPSLTTYFEPIARVVSMEY